MCWFCHIPFGNLKKNAFVKHDLIRAHRSRMSSYLNSGTKHKTVDCLLLLGKRSPQTLYQHERTSRAALKSDRGWCCDRAQLSTHHHVCYGIWLANVTGIWKFHGSFTRSAPRGIARESYPTTCSNVLAARTGLDLELSEKCWRWPTKATASLCTIQPGVHNRVVALWNMLNWRGRYFVFKEWGKYFSDRLCVLKNNKFL